MATRKINFQRFKEGDFFSTTDIDERFSSLENDINENQDGLDRLAIGEGALNYQHLSSPGRSTTSDGLPRYNFGSTVVQAKSIYNAPSKNPNSWLRYNPRDSPDLWTNGRGTRWSLHHGLVIGSTGDGVVASGGFSSKRMEMSVDDLKMGSIYYDLNNPGYTSAILLMFNTYVMRDQSPDGIAFELQVRCNTGPSTVNEWVPIKGSGRYSWDPTARGTASGVTTIRVTSGQSISIRCLLTRQRILDSFGPYNNPHVTAENMIVEGFRAKIGVAGDGYLPTKEAYQYIYLRESSLSMLAFRAKRESSS